MGYGLFLLREEILGPERFDFAFRTYINRWAFKHPQPKDFFRTMNEASGEDLTWFWREWVYNNWTLDQAVTTVAYVNQDPAQGALITVENQRPGRHAPHRRNHRNQRQNGPRASCRSKSGSAAAPGRSATTPPRPSRWCASTPASCCPTPTRATTCGARRC